MQYGPASILIHGLNPGSRELGCAERLPQAIVSGVSASPLVVEILCGSRDG
jgi:hypothetical protein